MARKSKKAEGKPRADEPVSRWEDEGGAIVKNDSLKKDVTGTAEGITELLRQEALLKTGALQSAIFNSANFSSIAPTPRASSRSSTWVRSACWATRPLT